MSEIKERPIIFSSDSVRAILENRKTQTINVIKPQPLPYWIPATVLANGVAIFDEQHGLDVHRLKCPYGQLGDRLWVRETFCDLGDGSMPGRVLYKASFDDLDAEMMRQSGVGMPIWKSPVCMPRWASRITLEIINIRVERLQDISIDDIYAEGCPAISSDADGSELYEWYSDFWDSINAKRGYSWESNPFVWVIEFKYGLISFQENAEKKPDKNCLMIKEREEK